MADDIHTKLFPNVSYRSILEQIQDGIYITNPEREIVYWNSGAEKLLGFTREDIIGRRCYDRDGPCGGGNRPPLFCSEDQCAVITAFENGFSGTYPHIVFMRRRDGSEIPVSLNIGPIRDETGTTIGGICVFRDMREEHHQRLLAGEIQRQMNISGSFTRNGVSVQAIYRPVDEVGGDIVETFFTDPGTFYASAADATGHGMSAALFTMIYRTLLRSTVDEHRSPAALLEWINARFSRTTTVEGFYLTASIVRLDPRTGSGLFASAGHPPALIFTPRGGGYELSRTLDAHSMLIGADAGTRYRDIEFTLGPGELLLLGTDGLFEAETVEGTFFGIPGIARFFIDYAGTNPAEELYAELQRASRYVNLTDDVGILVVNRLRDDPDGGGDDRAG